MAVRFLDNNDRVRYQGAGLPDLGSGATLTMWIKLGASTGTFATFARISAADATSGTYATTSTGTGGPTYATAGGVLTATAGMTTVPWYRYAMTRLGGTGNLYTADGLGGATELISGAVSGADNPDQICFGGRSASDSSEALNGLIAYAKLWGTVLDQDAIEAEWLSTVPVIATSLAGYWPLITKDDLTDHSGNGLHLSLVGGGNAPGPDEDGPPISPPSSTDTSRFLAFFP